MKGHFEPISGILRVFEDDKNYGDDYIWCVTVRFLNLTTVELLGITKAPTPSIWRAVRRVLFDMKIDTVVIYKILSDGTVIKKIIKR